jgi:EAL domain-containing protein (putative c-di-GMP-specific phosphodiesterase class I)
MLQQIHDLGVRTALDDFGTGHSSLVRLKEFPLSTLKIDGSFVQNVTTDEDAGSIVSGVIALGHALGLTVVAEGVEHERQLSLLRHLGCDLAQGYLFARPLTGEDATTLLAEHRRLGHGFAA